MTSRKVDSFSQPLSFWKWSCKRRGAALQVPGAAGVELGADDFAVAFAQFADEEDVGEREKQEGADDEEGGVPEIEPKAEAERLEKGGGSREPVRSLSSRSVCGERAWRKVKGGSEERYGESVLIPFYLRTFPFYGSRRL